MNVCPHGIHHPHPPEEAYRVCTRCADVLISEQAHHLELYTKALQFYADRLNWRAPKSRSFAWKDAGSTARETLGIPEAARDHPRSSQVIEDNQ